MAASQLSGLHISPASMALSALCVVWLVLYLRRLTTDMRSAAAPGVVTRASRRKMLLPSAWELLLWMTLTAALMSLSDAFVSVQPADIPLVLLVVLAISLPMVLLGSLLPRWLLIGPHVDRDASL